MPTTPFFDLIRDHWRALPTVCAPLLSNVRNPHAIGQ
jgi:hypothetical protein